LQRQKGEAAKNKTALEPRNAGMYSKKEIYTWRRIYRDMILCKLRTIFYLPPRFADYQK